MYGNTTQLLNAINKNLSSVYFYSSLVSLVSVILVVLIVFLVPRLRKHPAQLLFNRTMLDFVICIVHLVTYAMDIREQSETDREGADEKCRELSILYQIALFGSNGWYFILSVDLYLAIRNPFSCHSDYIPYYYVSLYVVSIATGFVLLANGEYGLTIFNYCWVKDPLPTKPTWKISASRWAWGLYYGPHLVLCIFSLSIVAFASYALRRGLPASDGTRKQVLKFGFFYVVAFAVEWLLRLILWLVQDQYLLAQVDWMDVTNNAPVDTLHRVAVTYAVFEGLRAFFDAVLWFVTGSLTFAEIKWHSRRVWRRLRSQELTESLESVLNAPLLKKLQEHDEVSSVLRHDMIRCTSWGIIDTAPVASRTQSVIQYSEKQPDNSTGGRDIGSPVNGDSNLNVDLWFGSDDTRTRRIHCPVALQSTRFDFRDYSPEVFSCIRSLFGVDPQTYCSSFAISDGESGAMVEKFTEGRSGSFFYFTQDSKYIVKTVSSGEASFLHSFARDYFIYLHSHPESFLTRFFGLHAMRLSPEQAFITLMVMENIFPANPHLRPMEKYDLKGSWVSRRTLKGNNLKVPLQKLTLKDSDLKFKFRIGTEMKAKLMKQLRYDVKFLVRMGIMDYSLLVGVRQLEGEPGDFNPTPEPSVRTSMLRKFSDGSASYQPPDLFGQFNSMNSCVSDPVEEPRCWYRSFHGGLLSSAPTKASGRANSSLMLLSDHKTADNQTMTTSFHVSARKRTVTEQMADPDTTWCVYYIGLIDILQRYNFSKKMEHFFKAKVRRMDPHGISAVNVQEYATRFLAAMDKCFV